MEIERQQPGGHYQVTGDTSPGSIILTAQGAARLV